MFTVITCINIDTKKNFYSTDLPVYKIVGQWCNQDFQRDKTLFLFHGKGRLMSCMLIIKTRSRCTKAQGGWIEAGLIANYCRNVGLL